MDNDWFAMFLIMFNLLLSATFVIIRFQMGIIANYNFFLMTGLPLDWEPNQNTTNSDSINKTDAGRWYEFER